MPSFPSYLFELTARDQQVTPLEILNYPLGSTANSAVLQYDYVVPRGKVLLLDNIGVQGVPNASQILKQWYTVLLIAGSQSVFLNGEVLTLAAGVGYYQGENYNSLAIGEGTTIRTAFTFDSGVAVNTAIIGINGVLIPRGNFAI